MKNIFLVICSIVLLFNIKVIAQTETLMTIDNNKVSKYEFSRIYEKNKTNLSTGEVTSLNDYLELFINFKLKVYEAEKVGLDTMSGFVKEFEGYKKQLAKPYLLDGKVNEQIIKEAYDRMQLEVRASHILIKLSGNAFPKDTLKAYNKALEIKRRILNGEDFEVVAKGSSDDPSVKDNGGDLGYFTVFQMIYPFESAVYETEIGEVSDPVRTRYGYHIVKVTDKQNARGQIKVAHIMVTTPVGSTEKAIKEKKELINTIYHKIKQGEDFKELAMQYSDDKGSARNGGDLPWFGVGRMVKEFETAAFNLTFDGEVSQPVQTGFGWHIIKRIGRKEIPSFEDARNEIIRKSTRDQRADVARNALIEQLKAEYNFSERVENIPVVYDTTANEYIVKLKFLESDVNLGDTLFSFLDKVYFENDFIEYAHNKAHNNQCSAIEYKNLYEDFKSEKILQVEEDLLINKYPEYRLLLQEYHDGMLLFEITDKQVWQKAINDSIGLKKFYKGNKKNYMWDERWDGTIFICKNKDVAHRVSKIIHKSSYGRKVTQEDLLKEINKDSEFLTIESGVFSKGDNKIVDKLIFGVDLKELSSDNILIKGHKIKSKLKTLDEARGAVISDYQDYLEKQWIGKLRKQYNIKVNDVVLSSMK